MEKRRRKSIKKSKGNDMQEQEMEGEKGRINKEKTERRKKRGRERIKEKGRKLFEKEKTKR